MGDTICPASRLKLIPKSGGKRNLRLTQNSYENYISILTKIKINDIQAYKEILGDRTTGWIESGWHGPSDLYIHRRLHKYICSHGKERISATAWTIYRTSVWATNILFVVVLIVVPMKLLGPMR